MTITFPLPPRLLGIPGVRPLELEVVEAGDLSPHMRRIRLAGSGLDDFTHEPGQDIMLVLGGTSERPLSRRYTIRRFETADQTVELNIVTHGTHGPGAEWVAGATTGDRVNGVGPRGKIFLDREADWHLFLADESGAPAALAMLEALSPSVPGAAFLEIPSPADELANQSRHQVSWLPREPGMPAGSATLLVEAMRSADIPAGRGHVYISAEVQVVAAVQREALARGLANEQLSPKAYWGRAKPNANNGEPEKEA